MSTTRQGQGLEARHLKKAYGSRKVVHDVSVHVSKGEVVGLLGPNGAGKTTSFYMIVGLVRADGGQILIDGQDVTRAPMHKRSRLGLSYLPQEASVFRKLSVADNVRAILELQEDAQGQPLSRSALEAQLEQLLSDLRVDHLRDSPSIALSGGERRRVEIARALATQPRFILLDEPFAGVDPIAVLEIQRIIGFLKDRGIGVLVYAPFGRTRLWSRVKGVEVPAWAKEFDATTWAQFFLKYVASHPAVTCITPATSRVANVIDNAGGGVGKLPDAEMRKRMIALINSLPGG